jgi:hypothetical protein
MDELLGKFAETVLERAERFEALADLIRITPTIGAVGIVCVIVLIIFGILEGRSIIEWNGPQVTLDRARRAGRLLGVVLALGFNVAVVHGVRKAQPLAEPIYASIESTLIIGCGAAQVLPNADGPSLVLGCYQRTRDLLQQSALGCVARPETALDSECFACEIMGAGPFLNALAVLEGRWKDQWLVLLLVAMGGIIVQISIPLAATIAVAWLFNWVMMATTEEPSEQFQSEIERLSTEVERLSTEVERLRTQIADGDILNGIVAIAQVSVERKVLMALYREMIACYQLERTPADIEEAARARHKLLVEAYPSLFASPDR